MTQFDSRQRPQKSPSEQQKSELAAAKLPAAPHSLRERLRKEGASTEAPPAVQENQPLVTPEKQTDTPVKREQERFAPVEDRPQRGAPETISHLEAMLRTIHEKTSPAAERRIRAARTQEDQVQLREQLAEAESKQARPRRSERMEAPRASARETQSGHPSELREGRLEQERDAAAETRAAAEPVSTTREAPSTPPAPQAAHIEAPAVPAQSAERELRSVQSTYRQEAEQFWSRTDAPPKNEAEQRQQIIITEQLREQAVREAERDKDREKEEEELEEPPRQTAPRKKILRREPRRRRRFGRLRQARKRMLSKPRKRCRR